VPESLRAPAHQSYIASFMASLAGSYSGSTVSNYLYGLRAWHILHSVEWKLNALEMEALLKGAARLAPDSSKRKQRQPYTPEFITKVGEQLDLTDHLDASVYACLTDGFYSVARVGELTVPRLNAFDPAKHVTPANLRTEANQNGMEVTVLRVPSTKAAPLEGEDIYWSCQHGPTDPYEALANHRRVNNPGNNDHLFAYRHKGRLRPLTKSAFIKRVAAAARSAGLEPLQGHGIRIGATLHYLLRGVPFEAVKAMGRWSSDAFLRYLRKHAQILMPYIQADPDIHRTFSHFIMPTQAMLQGRQ
jgi:integrase